MKMRTGGPAESGIDGLRVMGILNVTPDSFSDGGRYSGLDAAIRHAEEMIADGASIIDVGGESTRPGAQPVPEMTELDRVIPVLEALRGREDVLLSVDTSKAAVMRAAVAAGAGMINDVFALRRPNALQAAAELGVYVCLVHMQGEPATMQAAPRYGDVVEEVAAFLEERVSRCVAAGIQAQKICIDPGFGFGKTDRDNLLLLQKLGTLQRIGLPIMVGLSRKRTLGSATGRNCNERLAAGVAAATIAVLNGASIVRTHDVAATADALGLLRAMHEYG